MLEFIEEPLDSVTLSVKPPDEGRRIEPVRHGADIAPSTASSEAFAKGIGIICSVGQENIAGLHGVEHVGGASPVMGLAFGQFQRDGQPGGIDQGMDLGRQAAPRAAHATGSDLFFYHSSRADEPEPTRIQSSLCRHRKPLKQPPNAGLTPPVETVHAGRVRAVA